MGSRYFLPSRAQDWPLVEKVKVMLGVYFTNRPISIWGAAVAQCDSARRDSPGGPVAHAKGTFVQVQAPGFYPPWRMKINCWLGIIAILFGCPTPLFLQKWTEKGKDYANRVFPSNQSREVCWLVCPQPSWPPFSFLWRGFSSQVAPILNYCEELFAAAQAACVVFLFLFSFFLSFLLAWIKEVVYIWIGTRFKITWVSHGSILLWHAELSVRDGQVSTLDFSVIKAQST